MLKCFRLHATQSTNTFPSTRLKSFRRNESHAILPQNALNTLSNHSSVPKRWIHRTGLPAASAALATERTKYESNTLPRNTHVVICGGGVMGGECSYCWISFDLFTICLHRICFHSAPDYFGNFPFPLSAAVAYHLAVQGLGHEVVLLEQDRFVLFLQKYSFPFESHGSTKGFYS